MASGATILQAVVATWLADNAGPNSLVGLMPGDANNPGGVWTERIPKAVPPPYCKIDQRGIPLLSSLEAPAWYSGTITFNVYGNSTQFVEKLAARVSTVFQFGVSTGAKIYVPGLLISRFTRKDYQVEDTSQDWQSTPITRVAIPYEVCFATKISV